MPFDSDRELFACELDIESTPCKIIKYIFT